MVGENGVYIDVRQVPKVHHLRALDSGCRGAKMQDVPFAGEAIESDAREIRTNGSAFSVHDVTRLATVQVEQVLAPTSQLCRWYSE